MGKLRRGFVLLSTVVTLTAIAVTPASADMVLGDRIDVSRVTGHLDGTHTFAVSYRCASTSRYADLWIKTRELDGQQHVKVFGHGELGTDPSCTGYTQKVDITVSASDPTQWLTTGTQNFWAFFCDSVNADVCDVDTTNDATVIGSMPVLTGKGGVPPVIPDDIVILSTVDDTTHEIRGTYVCPTGRSHAGLGGQIFQDQGLLAETRADFSWSVDDNPICDGTEHEFTAIATADQPGHTFSTTDPATSSATFTAIDSPAAATSSTTVRTDAVGSDMQINRNGGSYASASVNIV